MPFPYFSVRIHNTLEHLDGVLNIKTGHTRRHGLPAADGHVVE